VVRRVLHSFPTRRSSDLGGRSRTLPEFRVRISIFARPCIVGQTFLSVRSFLPLQRRQAGMPVLLPLKQRLLRACIYLLAGYSIADRKSTRLNSQSPDHLV